MVLVLGLGIGYIVAPQGVDTSAFELQISDLEGQINDRNLQIATLQSQMATLNETLQSRLLEQDELVSELQSNLTLKDDQIQELQEQFNDTIAFIETFNQSYLELQADYDELLADYEELLADYVWLNAPVSNFTSIGDLDLTIATHQHIYSYKDPLSGNVTVYYNNGTAFEGTFSIYILCITNPPTGMSSGWNSYVNGYGEFYVGPPQAFRYGPGIYQIGIVVLYDSEGYIIENEWAIFPYVQVEAK